jgi:hypothetical protein
MMAGVNEADIGEVYDSDDSMERAGKSHRTTDEFDLPRTPTPTPSRCAALCD